MMKTTLKRLCLGMVLTTGLLTANIAYSQIDYFEDFSGTDDRWLGNDFHTTDVAVCDNEAAFRANPVNNLGTVIPVETVSPSLGISNGEEMILTYNYKLLYYDDVLPYAPLDDPDWGIFLVEYGPTRNGPWTTIDAITPEDHIITDECLSRKLAFTPPVDTEVYLRILAGGGTNQHISYYVYVDDISALQRSLTIDPVIEYADLIVYPNPVTDYLNLDYNGFIDDVVLYDMQGREVLVEDIDRDLRRLDMSTLPFGNYILRVATGSEVQTVTVVKN